MSIYLDIETTWDGQITVVGFYNEETGLVQLYGEDVNRERLLAELPEEAEKIFTYNGHCFDLRLIHSELAIDLRMRYQSHDLRWICQRNGLTGGLKGVERKVGIVRRLEDVNGRDAIRLWTRYERGDEEALRVLLLYNEEDVMNLVELRDYLERESMFSPR